MVPQDWPLWVRTGRTPRVGPYERGPAQVACLGNSSSYPNTGRSGPVLGWPCPWGCQNIGGGPSRALTLRTDAHTPGADVERYAPQPWPPRESSPHHEAPRGPPGTFPYENVWEQQPAGLLVITHDNLRLFSVAHSLWTTSDLWPHVSNHGQHSPSKRTGYFQPNTHARIQSPRKSHPYMMKTHSRLPSNEYTFSLERSSYKCFRVKLLIIS